MREGQNLSLVAYPVVVDDVGPEVSTDIQISVSDASLFDLLGTATAIGGNIQARVTQRRELYREEEKTG